MPLKMYTPNGTIQTWEDGIMKVTGGRPMTNDKDGVHAEDFRCDELDCKPVSFDHQNEHMSIDEKMKQIFPLMPHEVPPPERSPVTYYREEDVKTPPHYAKGGIETIDHIRAKLSPEEFCGYCRGNVMKYIDRYTDKGGLADLKKLMVYAGWLVEAYEKRLIFPHKVVE